MCNLHVYFLLTNINVPVKKTSWHLDEVIVVGPFQLGLFILENNFPVCDTPVPFEMHIVGGVPSNAPVDPGFSLGSWSCFGSDSMGASLCLLP